MPGLQDTGRRSEPPPRLALRTAPAKTCNIPVPDPEDLLPVQIFHGSGHRRLILPAPAGMRSLQEEASYRSWGILEVVVPTRW
jgi:hypothetical protein